MKTVQIKTESYLFRNSNSEFRAIPFYELSIDEWIIYENGEPKYFLDFNNKTAPLISDINKKLDLGKTLEEIVKNLGIFIGKNWTISHNIIGEEIENSQQEENIEVFELIDLRDLFIDLYFVATDFLNLGELINEDKLFEKYLNNGNEMQTSFIDNYENLIKIFEFLFKSKFHFKEIYNESNKIIYDLTAYKNNTIEIQEFEVKYENILKQIGRTNSMDEYANLFGIISYIKKYSAKSNLILIAEKRKHYA